MTNRIHGLPDEILTSIVGQIQNQVPELNSPGKCFVALNPEKTPGSAAGDYFCVVAPRAGTFVSGYLYGGGSQQCTVETGFVARIYSTAQIDPALRDGLFLSDASRGIFQVATKVLQALVGFDPAIDGMLAAREPLEPLAFDIGRNERSLGWLELRFKLVFDWNLS